MSFIIQITKGLIRDAILRRKIMGACVLMACVMLLAGGTVLWRSLTEEPWAFFVFWAVCLWMTVLSLLLAVYDLLLVRMAARLERERLQRKILTAEEIRDHQ